MQKMNLMQTVREVAPELADRLNEVASEEGMELTTLVHMAITDFVNYRKFCKDAGCDW